MTSTDWNPLVDLVTLRAVPHVETAAVAGIVRKLTPEYLAAQLAGSSRLEGIRVSAADEKEMASIIRGEVSEASLIRSLKSKYRAKARRAIELVR
jgi:hypothetical protein